MGKNFQGRRPVFHGAPQIEVLTQRAAVAGFTDGGGASGTFDFVKALPIGAIVLHSRVVVDAGFAGDTTATATLGDGTDVDRYNTSTINVFTTAADAGGVATGVPSGVREHTTAKTPVITVTTGSDFALAVTNGAGILTAHIYYIRTV